MTIKYSKFHCKSPFSPTEDHSGGMPRYINIIYTSLTAEKFSELQFFVTDNTRL